MKYLLKIFIFLTLLSCANEVFAQIKGVQYAIVYNSESNLYDCYLFINEGKANTVRDRVQFNAQFSIVVPTGANVSVVDSYMPLIDNRDFKGTQPMEWAISSKLAAPAINRDIDIYGITPSLAPAGFYNELLEGDLIKIFSISVTGDFKDTGKVRIFNNIDDPKSFELGMQNGDFSNGFTIGGCLQKYKGIKTINLEEAN